MFFGIRLRGDESFCPAALAQASSQFLSADRMHQDHCVVYKTNDLVFTLPQNVDNWVLGCDVYRFMMPYAVADHREWLSSIGFAMRTVCQKNPRRNLLCEH